MRLRRLKPENFTTGHWGEGSCRCLGAWTWELPFNPEFVELLNEAARQLGFILDYPRERHIGSPSVQRDVGIVGYRLPYLNDVLLKSGEERAAVWNKMCDLYEAGHAED